VNSAPVEEREGSTIGILNEGDFFGEGCLPVSLCAVLRNRMADCSVMQIAKKAMLEVLHREHAFSDMFVAYLLTGTSATKRFVDQLFNSSEKRLAVFFSCLLSSARTESLKLQFQESAKRLSQRWLAQLVGGLVSS